MLRSLKSAVKAVAAGTMYHSGLLDWLPRPRLTVLGYHRVLDTQLPELTTSPLGMVTTVRMFEQQLAFAARRYRMVSLSEVEDAFEARRALPNRACLVTFDDGWEDNYRVAYPILRRMDIPAAVFVVTDYIGTRKAFWFTSLMQLLLRNSAQPLRPGDAGEMRWPDEAATQLDRVASHGSSVRPWHLDDLIETLKRYPEPSIHAMVGRLAERRGGAVREERHFLTWDEIREMDRGGIGFGSHTCSHRMLTQLIEEEAADEIRRSKQVLEQELGHPILSIAFPNGSYTASHIGMAADAGYQAFFVSSRVWRGASTGRVFPRPCLHEAVGQGPGGRFCPSLLELHLSGLEDRLKYFVGIYR